MSLLPLHDQKDRLRRAVAHSNDTVTMGAYYWAIKGTIEEFIRKHERSPSVVILGGGSLGQIPYYCLRSGASEVTLVEAHEKLALENLRYMGDQIKVLLKSPLQLPKAVKYDMLIMDMFGSHLNSGGAGVYAYDLLSRGVIRDFDGERHVIPRQGAMTARMYHVPALRVADIYQDYAEQYNPPTVGPKVKFSYDLPLDLAICATPISERVVILTEIYDDVSEPNIFWPSHARVIPTSTDHPVSQCLLVLEWNCLMDQSSKMGSVLGTQKRLDPAVRRAQITAGPHPYTQLDSIVEVLAPVCLSISYRVAGGMNLTVVPSIPHIEEKILSTKRLNQITESTYAKAAILLQK